MAQCRPFQCSMRVRPTAQALVAEVAATLDRSLAPVPGLGLGWMAQSCPFQCWIRVWPVPVLKYVPTAQASEAEVAATPARKLLKVLTLGLGWTDHDAAAVVAAGWAAIRTGTSAHKP